MVGAVLESVLSFGWQHQTGARWTGAERIPIALVRPHVAAAALHSLEINHPFHVNGAQKFSLCDGTSIYSSVLPPARDSWAEETSEKHLIHFTWALQCQLLHLCTITTPTHFKTKCSHRANCLRPLGARNCAKPSTV